MGGFEACSIIKSLIEKENYKYCPTIGYTSVLTATEQNLA